MKESKVISGRYSKVVEDISVRNTFLVSLLLGVVGIIVGVFFGSTIIALAVPISMMAVYIGVTAYSKSDLPRTIIGDSYYYLGFIFTLFALMASLFSLGINEKVDMNAMVASFGAALITTIIGLTARLFINSFSVTAQQRREKLEIEIERALTTFSGQLEVLTTQVVSSVSNVHTTTQSTLQETLAAYEQMTNTITEKQVSVSEHGYSKVETALESLSAKIDNIEVSPDLISQPIRSSLKDVLAVINETEKKYSNYLTKFDNNANKINNQLDATTNYIESFLQKLSERIASTISKSNEQISSEIDTISYQMLESLKTIDSLNTKAGKTVDNELTNLSNSIANIVKELNVVTHPLKDVAEQIISGVNTISKGLSELDNNLGVTTDSIATLQNSTSDIDLLSTNIKTLNIEFEQCINVSKQANDKISKITNDIELSSKQLAQDISSVYGELTKQIKRLKEES